MSDPLPHRGKAFVVWLLGWVLEVRAKNSNGPEKRWYALEAVYRRMTPAREGAVVESTQSEPENPPYLSAAAVAARCEGWTERRDGSYTAHCPAHDDRHASLSLATADDGKTLVHCHAGCELEAILAALGLAATQLFPPSTRPRRARGTVVATYDYHDAQGTLRSQTVRYAPKAFRQRRPDPEHPGKWLWNLPGVPRVPFHLPQALAAIARGEPLYIVEGEKDVLTLEQWGCAATCNVGGAGKWTKAYSALLAGAQVVIVPDNDPPGRAHATQVAQAFVRHAASIKVVTLPDLPAHGDISDWVARGRTRDALLTLIDETPLWYDEPTPSARPSPPGGEEQDTPLPYSDYTNALALVREYGEDLRYCHPWGKWLRWSGTHWQEDQTGAVMRDAKATIIRMARRAETMEEPEATALVKHVKSSLSTGKLKAMLESAQSEEGIYVLPETLDQDRWLLNGRNGTVDLRTGHRAPHHRADLLTRLLPVDYDPTALCPTWERFLWRVMGGSGPWSSPDASQTQLDGADERATALITFLQRALGYCLTGDVREHILLLFYGTGKNGKSTLVNALLALLGPYAMKATGELLMVTRSDRHPTERADLFRKRLVATIETSAGGRLNEVFVKEATGGDPIRARRMREDFWQFDPTHKIILATNHKPEIRGTDHAIWRRIRLVPFLVVIPPEERNFTLGDALRTEFPGILAWLVRGCLAWQREGLGEPEEVTTATEGYRQEMDVLEQFFEEFCVVQAYASVKANLLYQAYHQWCEAGGESPLSQKTLGLRLAERGFTTDRGRHGVRLWRGIGLLAGDAR